MKRRNKRKIAYVALAAIATCDFGISAAQPPEFQGPRFEAPKSGPNGPRRPDSPPAIPPRSPGHSPAPSANAGPQRPGPSRSLASHEKQALEWAMFLQHRFHQPVELDAERKLSELPRLIREELGVPCTIDESAMRIAKIDSSSAIVEVRAMEIPLHVALKQALAPLNLAAKLTSDGLVITADFTRLARAGIATDHWAGISAKSAETMQSDLNQTVTIESDDMPLEEAVDSLQEQLHHRIVLDVFAMEDEGLSADLPVNLHAKETSFRSVMNRMLRDLNLTLQFEDDVWVVTTITAAEDRPLHRIHYLEATGLTQSIGEAMQLIQTSIDPESWEALGGMGTMAPLPTGGSNRPGILVSTTFATHLKIEALFDALRDGTVGEDLPTKSVPFQDPISSGSFHSGSFCGACLQAAERGGNTNVSNQNPPNHSTPSTPQQTGGMF